MNSLSQASSIIAWRLLIRGRVQGLGYRPALARLASELRLFGWVRNTSEGVEVHTQGPSGRVRCFAEKCIEICPNTGKIDSISTTQTDVQNLNAFTIEYGSPADRLTTRIPPDTVICQGCREELYDTSNRRYGYLLNGCSQCGPRYTILEKMPYEREATSMRQFVLCRHCQREYRSPTDRRFHAQTICCAKCGPNVMNWSQAVDSLRSGKIICIKGLGGYQLLVDAYDAAAIDRLRNAKGRDDKPFAVMISSTLYAEYSGVLQPLERELLHSSAAPIVIANFSALNFPDTVAKGLASIGLMLPTTALHECLTREVGPLVVTSGNLEGSPIVFKDHQAFESLKALSDVVINHERPILRPIDDSVVRVMGQQQVTLRLARGLAPLTLEFGTKDKGRQTQILAVGGHQKVAVALSNGAQRVLGPHLGDMDTLDSRQRFVDHVADLMHLYDFLPAIVVHDRHDEYFTTRWANEFTKHHGIRRIAVQHHHAHIVAGMIEPQWLDRQVLGVAWDGTGLGTDGTIWGGEFLLATATGFERLVSLRPFLMPGGEAAIREPWRIATALVQQVCPGDYRTIKAVDSPAKIERLLAYSPHWPVSSSMGRLFDAVAVLILPGEELRSERAGYEGHFAALLESFCDVAAQGCYAMPMDQASQVKLPSGDRQTSTYELDWRPLIRAILADLQQGTPPPTVAMRFHRTLAIVVGLVCELAGNLPVVLGGGVFQNKILVDLIKCDFSRRSVDLAVPQSIPINDGGLAAGQLAIANAILEKEPPCA